MAAVNVDPLTIEVRARAGDFVCIDEPLPRAHRRNRHLPPRPLRTWKHQRRDRAGASLPDRVERIKTGALLNTPDHDTFYGGDEHGYTDYPTLGQLAGAFD